MRDVAYIFGTFIRGYKKAVETILGIYMNTMQIFEKHRRHFHSLFISNYQGRSFQLNLPHMGSHRINASCKQMLIVRESE